MEKDTKPDFQAQSQKRSDEFKMQADEFQELRDQIDRVSQSDPILGNTLHAMANHLGHLHGYDYAREDAKKRAKALKESRAQEDADVKSASESLHLARANEDAMLTSPEMRKYISIARAEEDKRLDEQAKARTEKRAQEDKQLKESLEGYQG